MHDHLLEGLQIVVTRPIDQALALCEAIQRHGGVAISFPLLAISPLADDQLVGQQLNQLELTDWAIFISSNAVNYALPHVLRKFGGVPTNLKFAAIGHQTAKALALYGIDDVLIPRTRFDSETLLALPEMQNVVDNKIAIFRGVGGRELMADTLNARGAHVYCIESYRRINPQTNVDLLTASWRQSKLDAIIVTSSEAMRNLIQLADHAEWLQQVVFCVNHERIAEQARQSGLKVIVADEAGDEAMLQCLSQVVKHHG